MGAVKVGRRGGLSWSCSWGRCPTPEWGMESRNSKMVSSQRYFHFGGAVSMQSEPFSVLKSEVFRRKLIDLFSKSVTEAITTNAIETLRKYNVHLTTLPIT